MKVKPNAWLSWSQFLSLKPKALLCTHCTFAFIQPSHAKLLLCFIPARVRMGRAPCTWQLSMGGLRARRPSSRTVSFCDSGVALQGIRHIHSCNFQLFWPRGQLHGLLAFSWTDSSHSIVPSKPEILVVNKIPSFSSWQWSRWSIQILNLKTRIQRCI